MQAFFIVDLQNDFLPQGALPVPEGDKIIPIVNQLQKEFSLVLASQEWHPKGHVSFASTHSKQPRESIFIEGEKVLLWPDHCIQKSSGAEFPKELDTSRIEKIFFKGKDPKLDSYSAFFDAKNKETGLFSYLKEKKVDQVFLVGLALEYCVLATALDSVHLGFKTFVIKEGCQAIEEEEGKKAVEKMQNEGIIVLSEKNIFSFIEK